MQNSLNLCSKEIFVYHQELVLSVFILFIKYTGVYNFELKELKTHTVMEVKNIFDTSDFISYGWVLSCKNVFLIWFTLKYRVFISNGL